MLPICFRYILWQDKLDFLFFCWHLLRSKLASTKIKLLNLIVIWRCWVSRMTFWLNRCGKFWRRIYFCITNFCKLWFFSTLKVFSSQYSFNHFVIEMNKLSLFWWRVLSLGIIVWLTKSCLVHGFNAWNIVKVWFFISLWLFLHLCWLLLLKCFFYISWRCFFLRNVRLHYLLHIFFTNFLRSLSKIIELKIIRALIFLYFFDDFIRFLFFHAIFRDNRA